jgi:hypothetical protein
LSPAAQSISHLRHLAPSGSNSPLYVHMLPPALLLCRASVQLGTADKTQIPPDDIGANNRQLLHWYATPTSIILALGVEKTERFVTDGGVEFGSKNTYLSKIEVRD